MGLIDRLFGRDEDAHRTTTPDDLGIASANYAACQAEIAARNEEAQRHKELIGSLGRIEDALRLRSVEVVTSIKTESPRRAFKVGDPVRIQGYELINGNIVELMNNGEVRILLDGERVILSVIVHEKDVVLIEGAQS